MEDQQRSLADFLIKTAFTLLTALGGLTALVTALGARLGVDQQGAALVLVWLAVALLLATTVFGWRVLSTPRGAINDGQREAALRVARRCFIGGLCVLVLAPAGPAVRALFPRYRVSLSFAGARDNRIELVRERAVHTGLIVRNSGSGLEWEVELVAPRDSGFTVRQYAERMTVRPNATGVAPFQILAHATALPGAYPLVVQLVSRNRVRAVAAVDLVVTDSAPAAAPPRAARR